MWSSGRVMSNDSQNIRDGEGSCWGMRCFPCLKVGCDPLHIWTFTFVLFLASILGHSWSPWCPRDHRQHGTTRSPGATCEYSLFRIYVLMSKFTSISVDQKCLLRCQAWWYSPESQHLGCTDRQIFVCLGQPCLYTEFQDSYGYIEILYFKKL